MHESRKQHLEIFWITLMNDKLLYASFNIGLTSNGKEKIGVRL